MSETNFNELLSQVADDAKRPEPFPAGVYELVVERYELVNSSKKGTPGVEFSFRVLGPAGDTDIEDYPLQDLVKKTMRETFWLTPDAKYRLKDFLKKLGLDTTRPFSELLVESANTTVIATVIQTPSVDRSGETVIYNNISGFSSEI